MQTLLLASLLLLCSVAPVLAAGNLSLAGHLKFEGSLPLDDESESQRPSLLGRMQLDAALTHWRAYGWLEGGWDGTVERPAEGENVLKDFDAVYQSNTPFIEGKELYGEYFTDSFSLRAGIQRFAWGRLDEYPINDLLNPWDYTRFLLRSLEDRKIGVPSVAALVGTGTWGVEAVWVPFLVPYRLPLPHERWAGRSGEPLTEIPGARIVPGEPDLPPRTPRHSSGALRLLYRGSFDLGLNFFHGYDPRPVFQTTALVIAPAGEELFIDPGYLPDFHRISSFGVDTAGVLGDWSLRAEAAYIEGRHFNTRRELWGYPAEPAPGVYPLLPNQVESDAVEYGIGVDYRLFEDCLLTLQAQQAWILDRPETLYEEERETILWLNLKNGWLHQRLESNLRVAYNPEHADYMLKGEMAYALTDAWKGGLTAVAFTGEAPSLFGRFAENDQVGAELVYAW